jgi:hypothetical protein
MTMPRTPIVSHRAAAWALLVLAMLAAPALGASDTWAQQAAVQGIVLDETTSQPLPGANVVLERADQEVRSVVTDRNGLFQITGVAAGAYRLRIRSLGYTTHEETINLEGGQRLTVNRRLPPDPLQLEGIGVAGQGPGAVRRDLGGQTITARDLRRIPTPTASGDLVSFLQTMPGVVGTGDRGGQLFIRGGTPSDNLVLMDGMVVYQPFHITGFSSVFPEDLVNGAEFFPGGFGPRYSGRLSSVLDVGMRDGNRNQQALATSVSPLLAEVLAEGPLGPQGGEQSYIVSVRRSLIEETSPWLLGEKQPLSFNSYYLKLSSLGLDGGSRCSLTGMRTSDRGGLDPEDDESRVHWSNFLIGGRCSSLLAETFFDVRFGFSRLSSDAVTRGASGFSSSASRIFMDADASRALGRVQLNFGGYAYFKDVSYNFLEFLSYHQGNAGWVETGVYAEAVVPVGDGIRLLPGGTTSWDPATSSVSIEPRLRASWRPGGLVDGELSGALGMYGQRIAGISDRRDASSVFTAWVRPSNDAKPRALHAQASWQQSHGAGFSWSVDGYYRRMTNLPVATWSTVATFKPEVSLADGRAHGVDGRLEYQRGPFYVFGGYGYSWTRYESAQEDFGVWFGEPVQVYHPPHDRRHQANALASLGLGRYTFAARWELGSGFPFTRPLGFDERFDFRADLPNVKGRYGETRLLLDRPYNGRLPLTHRLDISLERLVEIRARQLQLQAGVINVYDQANIFYYDVFTNRRIDQLPFAPYVSVRLQPPSSIQR